MHELVEIYIRNKKKSLGNNQIINTNLYSSIFEGLSLTEYCRVVEYYCNLYHSITCDCRKAAQFVLNEFIVPLSKVFREVFPSVTYNSMKARRRLLQMPLVAMNVEGNLFLMEKMDRFDYSQLISFMTTRLSTSKNKGISKEEMKSLFLISQNARERECIRYAVCKSLNLTQSEARRKYGFENMDERSRHVEECIHEAKEIRSVVADLEAEQDRAILDCYGISFSEDASCTLDDSSDGSGNESSEDESSENTLPGPTLPDVPSLLRLLTDCNHNWFEVLEKLEQQTGCDVEELSHSLNNFFLELPNMEISTQTMELIVQSHRAFHASFRDSQQQDRISRSINGDIITDSESESDHSENYSVELMVRKKRLALKHRSRRLRVKLMAEKSVSEQ